MKPSRSSVTAGMVSAARGVGVSAEWRDPVAHAFASERLARRVARFERHTPGVELARFVVRALSLGLVDHNTLRMLLVDRALLAWRELGVRQVVLLGAGLDSRSWRLAELGDCDVFEVDHPDTQAVKRQRVAALTRSARSVAFVPVDFERDDLVRALGAAGHRSGEPTGWVCEGVSAYLPPAVTAQLLRQVGECSAPGSHLALSYVTPLAGRGAFSKALAALLVHHLGESARGFISRDAVCELLGAAGLTVLEDTGWPEWQQRFAGYRALPNAFKERLVIARKG
ncbi:MAG TPA: class I SAM-dependent methyltransferase [Polyangiaceae bacterium]|nr:class I SAM-dependent methyltransferase [Polyangiaceae bacterium]